MRISSQNKIINYFVLFSLVASFFVGPVIPAAAHEATGQHLQAQTTPAARPALQQGSVIDPDFDGIPTSVEQAGWYNETGGPYITDPNDADSDNDSLTDGEEKLYSTNPLNSANPGLFVVYRPEYKTRKFYSWQQAGASKANRNIIHSSLADETAQDVIVRRGNVVHVGAPPDAIIEVIKSDPSLTDLSALNNTCGGGWTIPIPSNGTVGTYTIRATAESWTKELTMYVIFELETPEGELTQSHIDVLGYTDDKNEERDNYVIYWDTSYDYQITQTFSITNHKVYGWGIGWDTDFVDQYVFEDHVMTAIQGNDDRKEAAEDIIAYTDSILDVNWYAFPNSTWNALKNYSYDYSTEGQHINPSKQAIQPNGRIDADCNGHASVSSTILKAAGFVARPIAVDWRNTHYDTSTEIWIDDDWMVQRAYYSPSPPGGSKGELFTRAEWGNNKYGSHNDLILVSGPDWPMSQININYDGVQDEDYRTDRIHDSAVYPRYYPGMPLTATSVISRWNWVETPIAEYWSGYQPPTVIADCNNNVCESGAVGTFSSNVPVVTGIGPETYPEIAHFNQVAADYGVDTDGDGRFDQLVIEVEIEVGQADDYYIEARLNDLDPSTQMGGQINAIDQANEFVHLEPGVHTLPLAFSGNMIGQKDASGPYIVDWFRITTEENPEPHLANGLIDQRNPEYITAAYQASDFAGPGARLTEAYSHEAQDTNGDGYIDRVIVNTGLEIFAADTYHVEANLTTTAGDIVASAVWEGTDGQVSLVFDAVLAQSTPYYIHDVALYGPQGGIEMVGPQQPGNPDSYAYSLGSLYGSGFQTQSGESMSVSSVTTVDSDSDTDYDQLNFEIFSYVPIGGQYKVEGWLESANGALLALRSAEVNWVAGSNTATLSFDGRSINAFGANGPYKLIGLQLYIKAGATYILLPDATVDEAFTTDAYSFSDFDGDGNLLVWDGVEGDPDANWNVAQTNWMVSNEAAHTPSQAWHDSPGGNYSAGTKTLTSDSISLANAALPTVSFWQCYGIDEGAGDVGRLQARGDSGPWQTIQSYDGALNNWQLDQQALNAIIGASNVEFRFELTTNGATDNGWYVDDITVTVNDDVDGDGLLNDFEGAGTGANADGDGLDDYLDPDSDNDNIPDSVEGSANTDGDEWLDFRDTDSDNDTISDLIEGAGDADNDGLKNYQDTDSDNDTIPDSVEGAGNNDDDLTPNFLDTDSDNDGIPDSVEGSVNSDGDSLPDYIDPDSDGDTIPDKIETNGDTDGDNFPDYLDLDADGDGIPDGDASTPATEGTDDYDLDGIPNFQDPDSDGDGIPDAEEGLDDKDGDGLVDYLDSNLKFIFLPMVIK